MNKSKRYLKISLYAIFTFFACTLIYKLLFDQTVIGNYMDKISSVFSPLFIGIIIAYFVNPIVNFFEEKAIPKIKLLKNMSQKAVRRLSVLITFILIITVIYFILNSVIPQISKSMLEIKTAIPHYYDSLSKLITSFELKLGNDTIDGKSIDHFLQKNIPTTPEQISAIVNRYFTDVLSITGSIVNGFVKFFVGVFIAVYLLVNKDFHIEYLKKIFITLLPANSSENFFQNTRESNEIFLSFISGKILDSAIIGIMCFIALLILKIPYAMLISLIVFITNMIPFFGPFIGGIIGAIFLIATYPVKAIYFIILILVLQQFDGNYLGPKILGDSTGLSPLYVLLAVIIFGGFFGVIGMFLGVPILAVIKNIFDKYIDKKYERKVNHIGTNYNEEEM